MAQKNNKNKNNKGGQKMKPGHGCKRTAWGQLAYESTATTVTSHQYLCEVEDSNGQIPPPRPVPPQTVAHAGTRWAPASQTSRREGARDGAPSQLSATAAAPSAAKKSTTRLPARQPGRLTTSRARRCLAPPTREASRSMNRWAAAKNRKHFRQFS